MPDLLCPPKLLAVLFVLFSILTDATVSGQADENERAKSGYLIDVPVPLDSDAAATLLTQLNQIQESTPQGQRATVVLRYGIDESNSGTDGTETRFEDALKVARAISGPALRRIRAVSLVERELQGHSVLPVIASDMLLVTSAAALADAAAAEPVADATISVAYTAIAERRGLFPLSVVQALVDPAIELARVTRVDGGEVFAAGDDLEQLRQSGNALREDVLSAAGVPLRLDARQLRELKIAAKLVSSREEAADFLDLAELKSINQNIASGKASGVLLEITGPIVPGRTRRWESNLTATLQSDETNTWLIAIDSPGGSLTDSVTLAGRFASPQPPLRTVAGVVRGEARGDAALVALATRPLYLTPNATIGGAGAEAIRSETVADFDELIQQIAKQTKRPAGLILGLLDRDLVIYRYTNRRTGRIRYATKSDIEQEILTAENPDAERAKWERGGEIDLRNGLSADQAVSLGLAEGTVDSLEEAARRAGLDGIPPPVTDRKLVRFVERIGRSTTLAFLLLFIGFAALSAEVNAPGLSVPGFIAIVCFGLYFWIKFLAGTAEWLELVAFSLGLVCIAIEVFVVPGFGVFGIGGLALTVLGIVLMSQTFVIPRNVYQIQVLTRGVWIALGGAGGMVGGFIAVRMMLPHVPILRGLVMESPDDQTLDASERLGDYSELLGQTGTTTTPLRPSGKAQFGDQIVQVISDGSSIGAGEAVRVTEALATRVVVESVETG